MDTVDRHGSIGVTAQPAMFDFSGNGQFYTFCNIKKQQYSSWHFQKLAAGKPLKGQVARFVSAGGADCPSQYKSRLPGKAGQDAVLSQLSTATSLCRSVAEFIDPLRELKPA